MEIYVGFSPFGGKCDTLPQKISFLVEIFQAWP